MKSGDKTVVRALRWGWRGFALEIALFCLLEGIGVGIYLVNGGAYPAIAKGFMVSAWLAVGALRLYRSLPVASAEITRMRMALKAAQVQGHRDATQPLSPPTRTQWTIGLIGVTIMLAIGLVINYGQPPVRIQCDRVEAKQVDCQVQSLMFWLIPVGVQTIRDVQTVIADSDARTGRSESLGESGQTYYARDISLAFTGDDQVQTVIKLDGALWGSFASTAERISQLLASLKRANVENASLENDSLAEERIIAWHTPSLPTLVSSSFVCVAGLVYFSGCMQLFKNQRAVTTRGH